MPIGLFELVLADAELVVEDVDLADVCEPAGARVDVPGAAVGFDWRACGPVRALEDAEVLECVGLDRRDCGPGAVAGKKLSDVLTTGENLIFFLASLQDSFSSLSSSEL